MSLPLRVEDDLSRVVVLDREGFRIRKLLVPGQRRLGGCRVVESLSMLLL